MQTSKIQYVIFNGPPGSGKSTCARELATSLTQRGLTNEIDSFAKPMKQFFMTALGDKYDQVDKEKERAELNGYSLRECWWHLDGYIKDRFGEDVLAKWLVHRSLRFPDRKMQFYIIDDGEYIPEMEVIPNRFVIKVTRPNAAYARSAHGYYAAPNFEIDNRADLPWLWTQVNKLSAQITGHV